MNRSFLVFRYDDYGKSTWTATSKQLDYAVLETFRSRAIPLVVAAIPEPLNEQPDSINLLDRYVSSGLVEVVLHGWDHKPSQVLLANSGIKGELPGLPYEEQLKRLLQGKRLLESWLNQSVTTLAPPWNRYDTTTLRACETAGIQAVTADVHGPSLYDTPVLLLPSTTSLSGLVKVIDRWEQDPRPNRLAVVCFHSYDFKEDGGNQAGLSLQQLDAVLKRVSASPGIAVVDCRTATQQLGNKLSLARLTACQNVYNLASEIWSSRVRSSFVRRIPFFYADLDSTGYETEQFYRMLARKWRLLRYLP